MGKLLQFYVCNNRSNLLTCMQILDAVRVFDRREYSLSEKLDWTILINIFQSNVLSGCMTICNTCQTETCKVPVTLEYISFQIQIITIPANVRHIYHHFKEKS